ncbi:MAG TPA: serine hydrolase [Polyangiales bacterium]|jgi:CubicO group peptidase (beta-lactamase class C family)|nr:serine hydrolase [Polyangiales bacterium]
MPSCWRLEGCGTTDSAKPTRGLIARPFGLGSLRAQWADGFLTNNYERATPYNATNNETTYEDSSWKVFGGGLELNVVDLARFGQLVLSGQIVSPTVRDTRLFSPVAPGCAGSTAGICQNGVAWELGTSSGRFVVEHGGSWTGARSFVRIYPNDDLVVAIMSNRTDHDPKTLGTSIGDIVLAP